MNRPGQHDPEPDLPDPPPQPPSEIPDQPIDEPPPAPGTTPPITAQAIYRLALARRIGLIH